MTTIPKINPNGLKWLQGLCVQDQPYVFPPRDEGPGVFYALFKIGSLDRSWRSWSTPVGVKNGITVAAKYNQSYDHVLCMASVPLYVMSIAQFKDLRNMHHVKRAKYMELLAQLGEIEAIQRGMANMALLQARAAKLQQEFAAL